MNAHITGGFQMKKLTALALMLFFTISLTVCSNNNNTQNSSTTMLPSSAAASASTISSLTTNTTPQNAEVVDSTLTDDIKNISVDILAANAYVLNVDSNSVLYKKNSNEHIASASTVKMFTALTVLDYCSLDDIITVDSEIDLIAIGSSRAWLNHGDTLTVKQLLVALLLPSGNDAAYTLAVNAGKRISGKDGLSTQQAVKIFVNAMNQKAKEVGAVSSNFVTPDGYDADGQYTTAYDLSQIAKECLKNDILFEIMGSYKIYDTWINGREVTYLNTNDLLNPDSPYYYSNAIGLKTGTSRDAGSCLVSAAVINGQTYICVVMGGYEESRFMDSLTIFNEIDPVLSLPQEYNAPLAAPGGLRRTSHPNYYRNLSAQSDG